MSTNVVMEKVLAPAGELWQGTMDSLSTHIAILDEEEFVVAVNAAWRRFAASEGGSSDYVGSNYVSVCEAAEADPIAARVARGLGDILSGKRAVLELEYPCHSPSVQRWYLMRATRYAGRGALQRGRGAREHHGPPRGAGAALHAGGPARRGRRLGDRHRLGHDRSHLERRRRAPLRLDGGGGDRPSRRARRSGRRQRTRKPWKGQGPCSTATADPTANTSCIAKTARRSSPTFGAA